MIDQLNWKNVVVKGENGEISFWLSQDLFPSLEKSE